MQNPIGMSTLNIRESSIAYEDVGSGAPLLLVHGHPFDRSMWAPQVRALEAERRVVTPDLRGYGESSVTPGKVTFEEHAADLASLLDALGIDRVVLGGLSMAGQIVLEFWFRYPERVRALILADTFAQLDTPEAKQQRLTTADRLEREGMDGYAEGVLSKMIAPSTIREQPAVASHVLRMMKSTSPQGAAASLRGRAERRDYVPHLPRIAVPVLIVVGEEDVFTPVGDAERMHGAIPGSRLEIVERAGHIPNLEQASRFNQLLASWLGTIR